MDDTGPVARAASPGPLISETDALAAAVAAEQAQINAAVHSADAAVERAMAAVAAAVHQLPTLDPSTGGPASLQQTVEATLKLQEGAVAAAIRQAEAAIAATVASTEATLGKLP